MDPQQRLHAGEPARGHPRRDPHHAPINEDAGLWGQLLVFIATGYVFKLTAALLDTIPFVLLTPVLARYLRLPPPGTPEPPDLDGV